MAASKIQKMWPALQIPNNLAGIFAKEAGVIKVRAALDAFKDQSIQQGAKLKYDMNVVHIDHKKGEVLCENGQKFKGKTIIVACGV